MTEIPAPTDEQLKKATQQCPATLPEFSVLTHTMRFTGDEEASEPVAGRSIWRGPFP